MYPALNGIGIQKPVEMGVGVDIERISRFSKAKARDAGFLGKFMTAKEIDYCFSKTSPQLHIAARFAGKEATLKALSGLSIRGVSLRDIEIANDDYGAPSVSIRIEDKYNIHVDISLSHSGDYAIAFAIAVRGERR